MKKGFRHQTHPEDFLRLNGLISNLPKTLNLPTPDPWERILRLSSSSISNRTVDFKPFLLRYY